MKYVFGLGCLLWLLAPGCSDATKDLASSDPNAKIRGLQAVGNAADDQTVEQVASAMQHEDARVAEEAALALGRLKSERAMDALRNAAASERRPEVRKWAVLSLGQRREPQVADTLRNLATRDAAPEIRAAASVSLGNVGSLEDVPFLAAAVTAEPDPQAAQGQVKAMERLLGGLRFPYDPNASPQARKEALDRISYQAVRQVKLRKNPLTPAQVGAKH